MKKRVLIVDDNTTNLYMLETILKGYGFEVISAENGKEALEKAHLNPPDLIVTDILMPVMDGYALCRRWRSDDTLKHIPLVFYTATYTGSKNEDFALGLGADRFILKPQEPDILMNILKEVLAKNYVVKQVAAKPLEEEMEFFRQYNEILFSKLEKKMLDLEIANQKLRISEECYRSSFRNASDVIYTMDKDLNIISMSPSVERILGYKPQDFIGRSVTDIGHILTPESFNQAVADITLILKGNTIASTVYRFIAKDGTIKYGEVSGSPLLREGEIIGIVSVARDITDRKRAEEALQESEKKYRELFDFLPIPVYEMDFEANMTSVNRAIYATFRGTEEDLKKGFKGWQLLSPEEVDKSAKNIQRLLEGEQIGGTEYTLRRLDGSVFPAIVISSVIYDKGKPVGLRGAIVDISQRKQQEEELLRTNTLLDLIIENIPNMIFLKDAGELRYIRFNRAGEDLLGHSRDDLLGKNDYDFFPKEQADFFKEKDREVLHEKKLVDIPEESLQTRNKGERTLHTKKVPILNAEGKPEYLLGISEDITQRKQAEKELRQTLDRLNKAIKATIQVIGSCPCHCHRDGHISGENRWNPDGGLHP
jgi:PAS domain S-box-containing protein